MRVEDLYVRLRTEFPDFTADEAWGHAERITAFTEQLAFRIDVEADLDALPTTTGGNDA